MERESVKGICYKTLRIKFIENLYNKFPNYRQHDGKDCGPTCLKIIAQHYNKSLPIQFLKEISETQKTGTSLDNISSAAEKIGFRSISVKISLSTLKEAPLPCIVHWNKNHFVVLYKIKGDKFYVSDPSYGLIKYTESEFLKFWIGDSASDTDENGIVLLLDTTPKFYEINLEQSEDGLNYKFLLTYIVKYKAQIFQLILGLLAGSLIELSFPFFTQSIVDVGIKNQNIHFIYLILLAQIALFFGRTFIDIIRGWILLHLSTRINIALVSDFFIKLMNLPIGYFDSRMTGDILQRINDHKRIERILTTSSLNVLFSAFNIIVFGFVLIYYDWSIFGIFFVGSVLYFLWIVIFLKRRRDLDYKRFFQVSQEQSQVVELINGIQEIKLNNAEKKKRWSWEHTQAKLYKISIANLRLEQYQSVGSKFINEVKNIAITIYSAKLVIDGDITLGMMLAISYIVGQLNSPISQLIIFLREAQDAKISLNRLSEIHEKKDEETLDSNKINDIPPDSDINVTDVSFRYPEYNEIVLKNIGLTIPANKMTAIVGVSGSGKSTLMRLLLKFYEQNNGYIKAGPTDLRNISQKYWRSICGVVMQEGYIFSDTIANNIAISEDNLDKKRLAYAVEVANIKNFIEKLPLSYNTKIGMEGVGLSTGQKQRMLIARAVYKNPHFLFFDEATSALDANNEKVIMQKLNAFFENKTVVVIAHRLSTVKNAHQIIVLNEGSIVEQGNHKDLISKKGAYYGLVKNQLELGN